MNPLFRRLARRLFESTLPGPVRSALRVEIELLGRNSPLSLADPPGACRVLVLAPHMDDEVLGCGGTLARCVARGGTVTVAYLTDGGKGLGPKLARRWGGGDLAALEARLVETRKREAESAGALLGFGEPIYLDLPDGALEVTPEAVGRLGEVLRRTDPEVIFLPFLTDAHGDHWMTNCLLMAAARTCRLAAELPCWGYEIWTPLAANTVVDITEVIERKKKAMAVFVSQNTDIDYPRAMLGLNTYRSLGVSRASGYAEAFYAAELGHYRALYEAVVVGRR